jgi:hypothetical protein
LVFIKLSRDNLRRFSPQDRREKLAALREKLGALVPERAAYDKASKAGEIVEYVKFAQLQAYVSAAPSGFLHEG